MQIAVNTDYFGGTGNPERALRGLADAGVTHVMWCHQWNTDFLYTAPEIANIRRILRENDLILQDVHGTSGVEKCWFSTDESERLAGVDLVRNRLEMMQELEAIGVLTMHGAFFSADQPEKRPLVQKQFDQMCKSLDELMPVLEKYNNCIAVENLIGDTWELLEKLLETYPADRLGITYDAGHSHMAVSPGWDFFVKWKERVKALHLHDNDTTEDKHQPPFYGSVDWDALTRVLASTPYSNPLTFEIGMRCTPFRHEEDLRNPPDDKIALFMTDAYERCARVHKFFEFYRNKQSAD